MKKMALVLASVAGLGFITPSFAMDNSAVQGKIQLAQANFSVRVGEPRVRERVIVRDHDRGYHRGWRNHRAHSNRVVIVKKHRPAKKTVIIER